MLRDHHTRFGAGIEMTRSNCSMLLAGASLVLGLGVPALAADLPVKASPRKAQVVAPYSWTGWYIGANAGYGVGYGQGTFAFGPILETFNAMPAGALGRGLLGSNYSLGWFVRGSATAHRGSGTSAAPTGLPGRASEPCPPNEQYPH